MKYKKLILLFAIITTVSLSCNKNGIEILPSVKINEPAYSVKNGIVKFSSFASYRNLLKSESETQKQDFIEDMANRRDYISLKKDPSRLKKNIAGRLIFTGNPTTDDDVDDVLSSDFLASLVNNDGLVQIGNYLFNVNLITERCYALHTNWVTGNADNFYYNLLLNENSQNVQVFNFSTDDDVLDILEDLGNPIDKINIDTTYASKRCKESAVAKRKVKGKEYFPRYDIYTQDYLDIKVVYQKAGFYFSLFGKLEFKSGGHGNWQSRRDFFIWKFKPKCKNERIQPYASTYSINAANGYKKFAYEDTRGLSKYDLNFQWEIRGHATTSNSLLRTQVYAIRGGY